MLCSGVLIRPRLFKIFPFLMHSRILVQPGFVCVALLVTSVIAGEIVTFQVATVDGQGPDPTKQGNTSEQPPGKQFTLGLYTRGKCKQAAGSEGSKATPRS